MMHYRKGENIEKQLTKDELPFDDFLPKGSDFLWMHVNGGTKVTNVVSFAKNALDKGEYKNVVWSGNGGGVIKTISSAEILKRSYPLYQVTRMCYTSVEEHWKPQMEGLDEIVVNRQIPSIHIFMSLEPIDESISGLQKPNARTEFWSYDNENNQNTPSSSSSNNNRNQRQRNGGQQGQRRPQKPRPQHAAKTEQQQTESNTANSGSSGNNQPNNSNNGGKRRRPHGNRDANNQRAKGNQNNANNVESMES